MWLVLMAAAIAAPVWMQTASRVRQERLTLDQRSTLMSTAVNHIRDTIPPNSVILVDRQSCYILRYYLDRGQFGNRFRILPGGLRELRCGGYRIVFDWRWNFDPQAFRANLGHVTNEYSLGPAEAVWVVDIGWDAGFAEDLFRAHPSIIHRARQRFGRNIELIQVLDSCPEMSDRDASPTRGRRRARTDSQHTRQ
jgi:hypothetical protein